MNIDVEKLLEQKINDLDLDSIARDLMFDQIDRSIRNQIHNYISGAIDKKVGSMILDEFKRIIDAPIKTDDGWGKKKDYASFEDLFKQKCYESLNSSHNWNVKRDIEKEITSRCNALFKNEHNAVIKAISENLIKFQSSNA